MIKSLLEAFFVTTPLRPYLEDVINRRLKDADAQVVQNDQSTIFEVLEKVKAIIDQNHHDS